MTTTKAKRFNKDGIEIADVGPLKDGERRSFPMSMMDHALVQQVEDKFAPVDTPLVRHSPGYLIPAMTDAQLLTSETNYAARKQKLSQAWLTPPPKPAVPPFKKDEAPAITSTTPPAVPDVAAAIAARDARLENAWRTA
jgi:hypothetical protein